MNFFTLVNGIRFFAGMSLFVWVYFRVSSAVNEWHYIPLEENSKKIIVLNKAIKSQDKTINELSKDIVNIISKNKVIGFEEFFKGYEDDNKTIVSTSGRIIF